MWRGHSVGRACASCRWLGGAGRAAGGRAHSMDMRADLRKISAMMAARILICVSTASRLACVISRPPRKGNRKLRKA